LKTVQKSTKLANVLYDIRGPIMDAARQMEEEGHKIIKLNIGNLAVFGFDAPEEIQQDMIRNLPNSAGYSDSKGIFAARKAVMHYTQQQGIKGVTLDDIYLGNGASELIAMSTNALLNDGDELLLPSRLPAVDRLHQRSRAARRCTTCATRPTAGCPTWTTSAPQDHAAPPRASWSSTRTTRPARCIPTNC
jgi:hypothetical protein